jgi:bifunctional DNA-binding transcriptional regulator/antitoxin component of YhaV-PrlF toxin-antitoxin module
VTEKTRLSSKGQVALPRAILAARNWTPGIELVVEETAEGVLLRPSTPFPPTRIEDVAGMARYRGKRLSLRDMEKAV